MPDPSYRGAGSVSSGTTTTNTLDVPIAGTGYTGSTVIAGDLAILVGDWGAGAVSDLTVSGSTAQSIYSAGDNTLTGRAFHKIVTGTDVTNGYITMSTAGTNARASAGVIVIADPGTVTVSANAADDANDTSQPIPANSTTAPMMVGVSAVSVANAATQVSSTPATGTTERFDRLTTNGSGRKPGVYGFTFNAAGPTSATSYTTTQNSHSVTWVYAVEAAGGTQYAAAGTVAGTSAVTGATSLRAVAAGTVAAVTAVAAAATSLLPSTGAVAATSAVTGSATVLKASAAGSVDAVSGVAGSVGKLYPAEGSVAAVSGATGATTARLGATGSVAGTSGSTGATTAIYPTGTDPVEVISGVAGSASLIGGPQQYPAAGTVEATTDSTGAALLLAGASGTVAAVTTTTGSTAAVLVVSGSVAAVSSVSGAAEVHTPTPGGGITPHVHATPDPPRHTAVPDQQRFTAVIDPPRHSATVNTPRIISEDT